jgi:hypothetical protein
MFELHPLPGSYPCTITLGVRVARMTRVSIQTFSSRNLCILPFRPVVNTLRLPRMLEAKKLNRISGLILHGRQLLVDTQLERFGPMNMTDELERLSQLHKDGTLSDEEFAQAKSKLLNQPAGSESGQPNNSLGEAANRYVTFKIVMGVIGFFIFLIFLFGVFLPTMNHVRRFP